MDTELLCTAGMKAACCHWGLPFPPQVCTPTPTPSTHHGDFTTPSPAKNMAKVFCYGKRPYLKAEPGTEEARGCRMQELCSLMARLITLY